MDSTMKNLEAAAKLCEDLKADNLWMLVNPQGLIWRGKSGMLMQVLVQQCPIETFLGDLNENMGPF